MTPSRPRDTNLAPLVSSLSLHTCPHTTALDQRNGLTPYAVRSRAMEDGAPAPATSGHQGYDPAERGCNMTALWVRTHPKGWKPSFSFMTPATYNTHRKYLPDMQRVHVHKQARAADGGRCRPVSKVWPCSWVTEYSVGTHPAGPSQTAMGYKK